MLDERLRDGSLIRSLAAAIGREAAGLGRVRLMHVCGTHERSVNRFGLRQMMPPNVEIVAGPGCPVCVCPLSELRAARELALRPGLILASFGDMLAVPAPWGSLLDARAEGAGLRLVYSASEALALARANPGEEVVFFSIGFETTAATTAAALASLREAPSPNFSLLSSGRLIPPALELLLSGEGEEGGIGPDGLILPGHVSVIIGSEAFRPLVERFRLPASVAGFEPAELLEAILGLLVQLRQGTHELRNDYPRAVRPWGNARATALMAEVFEPRDATWRGIGTLPRTGQALRGEYRAYDAAAKFGLDLARYANYDEAGAGEGACLCSRIMLALARPSDCPLFGALCRPESPIGPCMVSEEGSCRIAWEYGGSR